MFFSTTKRCPSKHMFNSMQGNHSNTIKDWTKTNHHLKLAPRDALVPKIIKHDQNLYLSPFHPQISSSSWKTTAKFVYAIKKLLNQFNRNDFIANLHLIFRIQHCTENKITSPTVITCVYYFMLDNAFMTETFFKKPPSSEKFL